MFEDLKKFIVTKMIRKFEASFIYIGTSVDVLQKLIGGNWKYSIGLICFFYPSS